MPSFIGNNIAFNGRGVVGADLILPDEYDYLGNGSSLFAKILRFYVGTHARASDNYMLAKNPSSGLYEMTGPFTSNVLATRNIGGEIGGVFEGQYATESTYSEVFRGAISNWIEDHVSVTDNAIADPVGLTTADLVYEDSANDEHREYLNPGFATDGSSLYYYYQFFKVKERSRVRLALDSTGFAGGQPRCDFNLSTKTTSNNSNCDYYGILELINGWFLVYIAATSNAVVAGRACIFYILDDSGNSSYVGDGSSGLYTWGADVIIADHWTNYIKAVASVAIKPADYFYWDSSLIPNWFKDEFTVKMIPNFDYPSQISFDKPIWSFQKDLVEEQTAQNHVYGVIADDTNVYWSTADKIKKMGLGGGTVTELSTGLSQPIGIAVDATYVYFATYGDGKIKRVPIAGGSTTDLTTGETAPYGLTLAGSTLYWTDYTDGKIRSMDKGGGAVSDELTGESSPLYLCSDSTYLYWTLNSAIRYKIIGSGSASNYLTTSGGNRGIWADSNNIYVVSFSAGTAYAVSKANKATTTFLTLSGAPVSICIINNRFYIGTYTSSVLHSLDIVTAYLAIDGKIKVIDGPDTKVETDALSCDMHDEVTIEFNRGDGEIKTEGFTGDDTFTGSSWTSPDGYDVQYGGALKGAASSDAILFEPRG